MGLQEDGFRVLSCVVCVRSSCCIVSGRVVVGVQEEGFVLVSCEVCVQVSCVISGVCRGLSLFNRWGNFIRLAEGGCCGYVLRWLYQGQLLCSQG